MLLDHFHPPLSDRYGWQGFHAQWAAVLTADLNTRLPEGWHAQSDVRFGIEVDVGVVDEDEQSGEAASGPTSGEREASWNPPAPALTLEFALATDVVEVAVYNRSYHPALVGAIELVSPANKDRPEQRQAFVSKCATILSEGAGLILVDIVTDRRANLHEALLTRIGAGAASREPSPYAVAYHPARGDHEYDSRLQIWEERLHVGQSLPILPLFLRVGPMIPIDLDETYRRTCEQLRIGRPETLNQSSI